MNDDVFIVDDDAAVRHSLTMLLDAAGYAVTSFPDASNFLDHCTPDTSGCIILDVDMPGVDGPALQKELTRRDLKLPIIFLSGHGTIPLTVRTIKAGAMDFLSKPVEGSVLLNRVNEALAQHIHLQDEARASRSVSAKLATLTDREREIMMLAVEGLSSKKIAERLHISYRTVELHRARIMQKTGASNILELARMAAFLK